MSETRQTLTIGSLFSGIGGLELGLERAGLGPVLWQVEKDDYARRVLAKHWPDATRYEDVRDVGGRNLAAVDVICGGFPCQDISSAGKRAGIRGERSGLWSEYLRIVRELRPRYVVVENVARLLADGMGVVLGDLAASGYDAEWDCLPAASVGAPHLRDRVFIVAYPNRVARSVADANGRRRERPRAAQGPQDTGPDRRDDARRSGAFLADTKRGRRESRILERAGSPTEFAPSVSWHRGRNHLGSAWESEPSVGRVAHGIPARLVADPLRALGNAVVPQVAEVVGRVVLAIDADLRGTR